MRSLLRSDFLYLKHSIQQISSWRLIKKLIHLNKKEKMVKLNGMLKWRDYHLLVKQHDIDSLQHGMKMVFQRRLLSAK